MLMPDHEKTNIVRGYLLGSLYLAKVLSQEDNNLIPILERHLITSSSVKSIIQKTNTFYENPDYFSIEIYAAIYIANYKETPVEPDNQPTNEDQT